MGNSNKNTYKAGQLPKLNERERKQFERFDAKSRRVFPCCICYFVESKKIAPIISVDYNVNIQNSLAIVDIRQVYENTLDKPAQIEYLFSINQNAAFTKLEVVIGDKTMYGIIKEKELAKQEYNQGIKDGKTMVYSEKDDEFPDVMRVKLGNLEPGQKLEVHFQYIQQLEVCVNEFWRLEIDPVVHPRYRLYKNDNQFMKKLKSILDFDTFKPSHRQNIKINIETVSVINFCKSPTHTILIDSSVKQNQMSIDLDPNVEGNFKSDKSFVLMFADQDIHKPQLYLTHTNNDALQHQKYCATLSLIPKFNPLQLDDAYQAYLNESDIDANDFTYQQKGVYLFVLDRSGSMSGSRINKAKEALILFIQSLPEDSYFNVISFGSHYELMFNSPQKYTQQLVTQAITQIEKMTADLGGTEILKPLEQCYLNRLLDYPQNIFILTDGEVTPDPVIDYVRNKQNATIRVYTLGIGNGCSKYLVEKLAFVGNGAFHFVADDEDLNKKVIDLLQDSITPYLENIQFSNSITNFNSITPNPETILCVKKNKPIMIQMIFPPQDPSIQEITIGFEAFDPQTMQKLGYQNTIKLQDSKEMDYFHKLAAYRQITIIEDEIKYQEPTLRGLIVKKDKIDLADIIQISVGNQVLSKTTAFICEVKEMADQFKQQQKVIEYYEDKEQEIGCYADLGIQLKQRAACRPQAKAPPQRSYPQMDFMCQQQCELAPQIELQRPKCIIQVQAPPPPGAPLAKNYENAWSPLNSYAPPPPIYLASPPPPPPMQIQQSLQSQSTVTNNKSPKISSGEEAEEDQPNYKMNIKPQQDLLDFMDSNVCESKISNKDQNLLDEFTYIEPKQQPKQIIQYKDILKYVSIDGGFDIKLLNILDVKLPTNLDQQIWITIIALIYLELNCQDDKEAWQLVYKKGVAQLLKNGIKLQDFKQQAIAVIN